MPVVSTPAKRPTLLSDHEQSTAKKPRTATNQRDASLNDKVQQRLRTNFKGWVPSLTDGVKVGGLTLRERLFQDVSKWEAKEEGAEKMGAPYYKKLKEAYQAAPKLEEGEDPLDPVDESLPIAPLLEKAAIGLEAFPPNREYLRQYLVTTPVGAQGRPNQTEVCGLFRLLVVLKPGCEQQREVALEGLRFIHAHGLKNKFQKEFGAIFGWIDSVLVECYKQAQHHLAVKKQDWIACHKELAQLVINASSLQAVMHATGSWSGCASQLSDVVLNSKLGKTLFGFAMGHITSWKINELCTEKLDAAFKGKLTKAKFATLRQEALVAVETVPGVKDLEPRRQIEFTYRSQTFTATVGSASAEVCFRFSAGLKGFAVNTGCLPELWCEDILVGSPVAKTEGAVEEDLIKAAKLARSSCKEIFGDTATLTNERVQKLLKKNSKAFMQLDADVSVELALMNVAVLQATDRLEKTILDTLPSDARQLSAAEVVGKLALLAESSAHKLAPAGAQKTLLIVREIVSSVAADLAPSLAGCKTNAFLKQVSEALGFFVSAKVTDPTTQKDVVVFGAEALRSIYKAQKAADEAGKAKRADVAPLRVFKHLIPSDIVSQAEELYKKVNGATGASSAAAAKAASAPSSGSSGSSSSSSQASQVKKALSVFRKSKQ